MELQLLELEPLPALSVQPQVVQHLLQQEEQQEERVDF